MGIKRKKGLAKKGLKKKPLKTRKKPVKLEKKTAQQLIKEADKWHSRYIRLRDSELVDGRWVGECITSGKKLVVYEDGRWSKGAQCGHFIGRGTHQLRYDEYNTNLQSAYDNAWRDKESMLEAYRKAITDKYGSDVLKELKDSAVAPGALKRLSKPELLQIIHDCKLRVDYMLANES